jgi:hypothetical protein
VAAEAEMDAARKGRAALKKSEPRAVAFRQAATRQACPKLAAEQRRDAIVNPEGESNR